MAAAQAAAASLSERQQQQQRVSFCDRLTPDCLANLVTYLDGVDVCRLQSVSRNTQEVIQGARAALEGAEATQKLWSLHFFSILEQQTRADSALAYLQGVVQRFFTGCLHKQQAQVQAAAHAAQAAQQQQQDAGLGPPGTEVERLKLVTAAAVVGGWWQPSAEADGGAARQLAALQALTTCFGAQMSATVAAVTSDARCPAAAKGFWGCIFLGILLSVSLESAARLVRSLLRIGAPDCQLFPDSSAIPVIAPLAAPGTAEDPGRPQCVWQLPALPNYVHYHARQFVSALLVLLHYLWSVQLPRHEERDTRNILKLFTDLQEVLIQLQFEEENAAVVAAQQQPDEAVWQIQNGANLLAAAGLRPGQTLTAEQFRILNCIPVNPRADRTLMTISALAGTGKSSTLRLLMLKHPDKTILYTAFNNSVVEDMKASVAAGCNQLGLDRKPDGLPHNVDILTTHEIAGEAMQDFRDIPGWRIGKLDPEELAQHLNTLPFFRDRIQAAQGGVVGQEAGSDVEAESDSGVSSDEGADVVAPGHNVDNLQAALADFLAAHGMADEDGDGAGGVRGAATYSMGRLMIGILDAFCASADNTISLRHPPAYKYDILTGPDAFVTPEQAVLIATQLWEAIINKTFDAFAVDFPWVLKAFVLEVVRTGRQLTGPGGRLYDLILFDDAQDINPVTYQLVTSQRCLVLFVGDHHQRLYRFSHAEDGLYRLQQEQPAGSTRALTLNHSFRLGPAVAEAANRLLHDVLAEDNVMVPAGRPHAAVYVMPHEPTGPDPAGAADGAAGGNAGGVGGAAGGAPAAGAAAAAAAAAAPAAGANAAGAGGVGGAAAAAAVGPDPVAFQEWLHEHPPYRQAQLLGEAVPPTDSTPADLGAVRVTISQRARRRFQPFGGGVAPVVALSNPLYLAVPPINPSTGQRYPLMLVTRTNATWFQVAAALAQEADPAGAAIRHILGRPPRLFLLAELGRHVDRAQDGGGQLTLEFLQQVENMYKFRYLSAQEDAANPLRRLHRNYDDLSFTVLRKGEEPSLKAPLIVCEVFGQRTEAVLRAIQAVLVHEREQADYLLGTCHKGRETEEMYAQLADDFFNLTNFIRARDAGLYNERLNVEEINLVYVAATRAKLGLVCNRDLGALLTAPAKKWLSVEVPPPADADDGQPQAHVCDRCRAQFDAAAVVAQTMGGLVLKDTSRVGVVAGAVGLAQQALAAAGMPQQPLAPGMAQQIAADIEQQMADAGPDEADAQPQGMCLACLRNSMLSELVVDEEQQVVAADEQ